MNQPTIDPDIEIEYADATVVRYVRLSTGQRWEVRGTCNQCGLCVIGAVGDWYQWVGEPGTPYSSIDTRVPGRLDDPILPELLSNMVEMAAVTPTATVTGCSTTAEYL